MKELPMNTVSDLVNWIETEQLSAEKVTKITQLITYRYDLVKMFPDATIWTLVRDWYEAAKVITPRLYNDLIVHVMSKHLPDDIDVLHRLDFDKLMAKFAETSTHSEDVAEVLMEIVRVRGIELIDQPITYQPTKFTRGLFEKLLDEMGSECPVCDHDHSTDGDEPSLAKLLTSTQAVH